MVDKNWQDLSVLIVGCGSIGKRHARALKSIGVKDIRACDVNRQQLESLIEETPDVKMCESFEQGLERKPDTVFILTPPKLHIPMAIKSIKAGCHVLSEKPLSDSMQGIEELSTLIEESGKKMMVALCFRYHTGLLKARKMLDEGKIGRLVSVRALMGEHLPDVRPDYRDLFSAKYCGAFDLMHDIDLAIWYADQNVKSVNCLYGNYSDIGIEAPDIAEILIGFEDRCAATVHLDFFQRPRRRQIELIGTEGVITVEFASWDKYTLSMYNMENAMWESITEKTDRDDMFRDEDREFLRCVAEDIPIKYGVKEACKSLSVVLKAQNLF